MKKRLSEREFESAVSILNVETRTKEIAKGVLVDGVPQKFFADKYQITKGAVWQLVDRVWQSHLKLTTDLEKVTVVLPKRKAFIVKKWASEYEQGK